MKVLLYTILFLFLSSCSLLNKDTKGEEISEKENLNLAQSVDTQKEKKQAESYIMDKKYKDLLEKKYLKK